MSGEDISNGGLGDTLEGSGGPAPEMMGFLDVSRNNLPLDSAKAVARRLRDNPNVVSRDDAVAAADFLDRFVRAAGG